MILSKESIQRLLLTASRICKAQYSEPCRDIREFSEADYRDLHSELSDACDGLDALEKTIKTMMETFDSSTVRTDTQHEDLADAIRAVEREYDRTLL